MFNVSKSVTTRFFLLLGIYTFLTLFFCSLFNDGQMFFWFVLFWIVLCLVFDKYNEDLSRDGEQA